MTQQSKNNSKPKRLVHIDMMVGMAMILVVMGHFTLGFEPDWYNNGLHNWIYSFHMEMFVFLSAFLIRYTYKGVQSPLEYGKYIWRKFKKFFVWFVVIGMAVAALAPLFRHDSISIDYLWQSLRTLLLYPRWSEASFLWYIYILFGYYLVSPLFFRLPAWVKTLCCVVAMFLPMLDAGQTLAAYDFSRLTFFYCLGVLCAEWIEEIRNVKIWMWGLLSVPFIAFSGWLFGQGQFIGFEQPALGWWTTVTGVASLPFFYLLALAMSKIKNVNNVLTSVSMNCYWIYLLQMFVIWGCAFLLQPFTQTGTIPFGLFFAVVTILAIAIPIALAVAAKKILNTNRSK